MAAGQRAKDGLSHGKFETHSSFASHSQTENQSGHASHMEVETQF
jgi:hypothetical protein